MKKYCTHSLISISLLFAPLPTLAMKTEQQISNQGHITAAFLSIKNRPNNSSKSIRYRFNVARDYIEKINGPLEDQSILTHLKTEISDLKTAADCAGCCSYVTGIFCVGATVREAVYAIQENPEAITDPLLLGALACSTCCAQVLRGYSNDALSIVSDCEKLEEFITKKTIQTHAPIQQIMYMKRHTV